MPDNRFPIRISIVIPVYNTAQYLDQCLSSIACQTYKNFDVFTVDDNSSDGSLEILKKWELKDKRYHLVRNLKKGVSNARNAGIDATINFPSKFDFIYFMDSDDYLDNNVFERSIKELTLHNANYAVFSVNKVTKSSESKQKSHFSNHHSNFIDHDEIVKQYFGMTDLYRNHPSAAHFLNNKIFAINVIANIKFDPSLKRGGDADFFLKILPNLTKGVLIQDIWYNYRLRQSSITCQIKYSGVFDAYLNAYATLNKRCKLEKIAILNGLIDSIWMKLRQIASNREDERLFFSELERYKSINIRLYKTNLSSLKRKFILDLPACIVKTFFYLKGKIHHSPISHVDYFE